MPLDLSPILNVGAVGAVLLWFLWKAEPRMAAIESAVNRLARAVMLATIGNEQISTEVRRQAELLLAELDEHERPHGGK